MSDYPQKPQPMAAPAPAMGVPVAVDQYGRPAQGVPMAMAQPPVVGFVQNNSNIQRDAQGNALCRKCHTPYPLPNGCTSWRCRQCGELNNASVYGDECPCCSVM
ncbi:hypothetical protein SPRG_02198 [Saprolegnia parasitica CBS 223.65]|uniref:Uncharacterized protein n=1 Tax=Saprolegnia parasitica (strain CBS 223.65) TaxID=695850 RepID=A0A067D3S4_SAPPC|nr:hypothetical protein SPRG_02198 [Saprolegnia parasitica CBS 223.65]KDO33391.1 hypothetical protein SPRG_02198 [Saprolegnia parasitica CBS 223.65]|eukprot:XP_012196139.1 hypothetical protein SPRG_02198 [Saprolegnia parasitica CBS 223.65]